MHGFPRLAKLAHFKHPISVSTLDDLHKIIDKADRLVFDDMLFNSMPPNEKNPIIN